MVKKLYDKLDAVRFTRSFIKRAQASHQRPTVRIRTLFNIQYVEMHVDRTIGIIKVTDIPSDYRSSLFWLMLSNAREPLPMKVVEGKW